MPAFSVIMSVYNHEQYVASAIESVIAQSVADWELVVIDDGSQDGSGEIIDAFGRKDRRIVAHHQKNAGLASARNTGARIARSAWLTYLDSDDIWLPEALEHFRAARESDPSASFFYGYSHRLRDGVVTPLTGDYQDATTGTAELFQRVFLNPMCVCHRKELWEKAGGFDPSLRYCDDYDLFLRMSLLCRFQPVRKPIGLRRRHGGNMSKQTGRSQETEAEVLRRFAEERGGAALLEPGAVRQRLARIYYRAARAFFREGQYPQAARMAQSAQARRFSFKASLVYWAARIFSPLQKRKAA